MELAIENVNLERLEFDPCIQKCETRPRGIPDVGGDRQRGAVQSSVSSNCKELRSMPRRFLQLHPNNRGAGLKIK